jgi:tartrate dehydrogenase/decarboxylase / D-malate dehydrogenase
VQEEMADTLSDEELVEASATPLQAIERGTADPALHTRDLGGNATTAQVTEKVCAEMAKPEIQITKM